MNDLTKFSRRVKPLRKSKNATQTELANLLNITSRHYQEIEYGNVDLPASKLIALADYFGVSIDYLVGRTDNLEINQSKLKEN
jgi:transcriptional regulator with XRE-family HTH domain